MGSESRGSTELAERLRFAGVRIRPRPCWLLNPCVTYPV